MVMGKRNKNGRKQRLTIGKRKAKESISVACMQQLRMRVVAKTARICIAWMCIYDLSLTEPTLVLHSCSA